MNRALGAIAVIFFAASCQQKAPRQPAPAAVEYFQSAETASLDLPFSDAVRAGNLLFVSGNVGNKPGTTELVEGGIAAETRQALENIKNTIESSGSSMDRVVKCTAFLAGIDEWDEMNAVYRQYFPKNRPARSALGANGLALGARVEIECIAAVE